MKYTFQHYVDIQTSANSLTMLQIQAGGQYAMERIKHLIGAYKYVKLGRVSVKLLPASTLPVDPLGLSYDDSDPQTIDPRDQMNPGLVRITNGEDIMHDFTGVSADVQQQLYINTMLDPRWSKFMLQSGFKRSAVPLYWNVGQLQQDPFPGTVTNYPYRGNNAAEVGTNPVSVQSFTTVSSDQVYNQFAPGGFIVSNYSDPRGFFQTGHRGRMGWMPTDAFYLRRDWDSSNNVIDDEWQAMYQPLPEVNVITVLLPKAYKTIYYYRMFITETVYLSGVKNTGINDGSNYEYRALDNFIYVPTPRPAPPIQQNSNSVFGSSNDGGGDKD